MSQTQELVHSTIRDHLIGYLGENPEQKSPRRVVCLLLVLDCYLNFFTVEEIERLGGN